VGTQNLRTTRVVMLPHVKMNFSQVQGSYEQASFECSRDFEFGVGIISILL
jgi:hypothetical protein